MSQRGTAYYSSCINSAIIDAHLVPMWYTRICKSIWPIVLSLKIFDDVFFQSCARICVCNGCGWYWVYSGFLFFFFFLLFSLKIETQTEVSVDCDGWRAKLCHRLALASSITPRLDNSVDRIKCTRWNIDGFDSPFNRIFTQLRVVNRVRTRNGNE